MIDLKSLIIPTIFSVILYAFIFFIRKNKHINFHSVLEYLLVNYLSLVLYLTLIYKFQSGISVQRTNFIPYIPFQNTLYVQYFSMHQYLLNILMLLPFGILVPIVIKKMSKLWKTFGAGIIFIFGIEATQYYTGRVFDINDIVANLLGIIVGYLIYKLGKLSFRKL